MIKEDSYPDVLYKYMDFEHGLSMIKNQDLWFTRAKNLNDPYDCYVSQKTRGDYEYISVDIQETLNRIFGQIGICSLCVDPSIFTMWSYYNKHSGLCLGVKMDAIKNLLGRHVLPDGDKYVFIKKVIYQEAVAKIDPYDIIPQHIREITDEDFCRAQNAINDFLAVKSVDWEREKEYRLVLREGNLSVTDDPAKVIIKNMIDCVYIGCKVSSDTSTILKLAKERKFNVYWMNINPDQYGLVREVLYEV